MSRRFGRNQRRRAREAQAALVEALGMAQGLSRWQSGRIQELESQIRDVRRELGLHTSLLPAQSTQIDGPSRSAIEVARRQEFGGAWLEVGQPLNTCSWERVSMTVMLARIDSDKFRDALHMRVEFGDRALGYAMSRQALAMMSRARCVQLVSREMAEMFAREFAKGDRRDAS